MRRKNVKKAIALVGVSLALSSCNNVYTKAIDLETANKLVNAALVEQNSFEVKSVSYSLRSEIKEYVLDESGNQKKVFKTSNLEVLYKAPYLRSDENTIYSLKYKSEVDYLFDDSLDTKKEVAVSESIDPDNLDHKRFIVTENGESHDYTPTTDSALASFINLPTLINSNNVTSLTLCQTFMSSIGKFNNLTSFEALSSGGDNFVVSFEGESLSVNDLYAEETSLSAGVSINSFSLSSTDKKVDYYESNYEYKGDVPELDLSETDIYGDIHVSYSYK
ncbi:MAG: hypothetical protein K6G74_00500 [Bacilli bacterium]|nr:hypothetical protein [Bacilli bacterium]